MLPNDPRKGKQSHNASPVEYGQGKGRPGWTGGDQHEYDNTAHPFCKDAQALYLDWHDPQTQARFESINNGTYFTQGEGDVVSTPDTQGETQRAGSADAPYPIHNWPSSVPARVGR
jgi:hypothetical protein